MPDDVVRDIIDICRQKISTISVSNWQSEGDAALVAIKEYLDNKYLPQWTVAAGKHFGTKITHDSKHFISFYLGDYLVVIFRCT
jgi:dynein light chain LC8-type